MKIFTVYARPGSGSNPSNDAIRMAFVKDGFCWPALFVPFLWLLWHRLWLVLLGWLAVALAIAAASSFFDWAEPLAVPAAVIIALWFAFEANGLRRWTLERHGWRFAGLAMGRNRYECEYDFFRRWVGQAPVETPPRRPIVPAAAPRKPSDEVIGLFPKAE